MAEVTINETNEGRVIQPLSLSNEAALISAIEATRDPSTSEFEALCENVVEAFDAHRAQNYNVNSMPSKVAQGMVNRLQNELLIDVAGVQLCQPDTINWGESYLYTLQARRTFKIFRVDAPGGPANTIEMKDQDVYDLGTPTIRASELFQIPRFEKYFVEKWVKIMQGKLSEVAADMADDIDSDVWTMVDKQLLTGDPSLKDVGFSHVQSRVKNVPSMNDYNLSAQGAMTKQFVQELLLHGIKMKRRLVQIMVPPPAMEGVWDWVDENTYAPRISEQLQAYIERTGGAALPMWGYTLIFTPVNTLEGVSGSRYVYAKYEPQSGASPQAVPPGAGFYVQARAPDETSVTLQYVGSVAGRGAVPGVYDQFILQQGLLLVSVDYQKPNIARFRYI